jgi:hypothetical protein
MFFGDPEQLAPVLPRPLDEWEDHYPYWNDPNILARSCIGYCYAMMVDSILTLEPSFLGDERYQDSQLRPEIQFHVKRDCTNELQYVICDFLTGSRSVIPQVLLEDPTFDISYWYAKQRSRALRLTWRILHQHCMGDVISIVATKLITDSILSLYLCTNPKLSPQYRFNVCPTVSDTNFSKNYQINDLNLEIVTTIPKSWLEDPTFDLVCWYRQHLDQRELFESRYYDNYQTLYTKIVLHHLRETTVVPILLITLQPAVTDQKTLLQMRASRITQSPKWTGMTYLTLNL